MPDVRVKVENSKHIIEMVGFNLKSVKRLMSYTVSMCEIMLKHLQCKSTVEQFTCAVQVAIVCTGYCIREHAIMGLTDGSAITWQEQSIEQDNVAGNNSLTVTGRFGREGLY